MRLDRSRCHLLLSASERGVLGTVHARRGVDTVPACFAVVASSVAVPVDRVKPKTTTELQRVRNLEADPRAVLLCDHWDPADWAALWWVRATLERTALDPSVTEQLRSSLGQKYPQYRDRPFADLLTFRITGLAGWSGGPDTGRSRAPSG
jgi:hypothetical protein